MDENQKESSSTEEDILILEKDDVESEDSDLDPNNSNTFYPQISIESLIRQPLHKESLQKTPEGQCSTFNKSEETEQQSAPTGFTESSTSYNLPFLCLGILIALVGVFLYVSSTKTSSPVPNKQLDVKELMRNLTSRFDGLPSLTYRVIESAVKRASSENPDSPGIIVLISSREAKETTHELANTLVQLVSKPLNSVLIDARSSLSAEHFKKEIDVTIRGNLSERQMKAVLVRNLDQIPFEAAMMFHSFCDHENAPFKRVIYVMTALVDELISPNSDSKQWDVLASRRLKDVWGNSGEDQVASLISRLTVSVAAVVPK